jgi:exosortase A-associated hydrolase 1
LNARRNGQVIERFATFDCDGDTCIGVLTEPASATLSAAAGVVVIVGGPQYRVGSHRQFVALSRALAAAGIPAFRFDYRGMGDSAGDCRSFEGVDADIDAAVSALQRETGLTRVVLWGLCDGASAALMHASADPRVVGIVVLNPWARSAQIAAATRVQHYYVRRLLSREFWHKALRGGVGIKRSIGELAAAMRGALRGDAQASSASFLDRMNDGLARFRGSVLCILSGNDLTAREFEAWSRQTPQRRALLMRPLVEIFHADTADHTFSETRTSHAVTQKTIEWIMRIAR